MSIVVLFNPGHSMIQWFYDTLAFGLITFCPIVDAKNKKKYSQRSTCDCSDPQTQPSGTPKLWVWNIYYVSIKFYICCSACLFYQFLRHWEDSVSLLRSEGWSTPIWKQNHRIIESQGWKGPTRSSSLSTGWGIWACSAWRIEGGRVTSFQPSSTKREPINKRGVNSLKA